MSLGSVGYAATPYPSELGARKLRSRTGIAGVPAHESAEHIVHETYVADSGALFFLMTSPKVLRQRSSCPKPTPHIIDAVIARDAF
jgi:hypothetical protein